ncbi:protein kinase [Nonomuraea sp. NPDC050691]|uniref:serine/threonine-protein kinase n=1 Tax=Nonomuraea sp. NPDC050691 TaxID=3155661 RepID=UPI003403B3C1
MPHVEPLREGDPAAVGPYRLAGRLGAGAQGVVYLAKAPNGAPVAVKILHEGLPGDDRLAREMAAARQVEPVNVAQVLDASAGGRPYIVSEYVDGPSLQQAGRRTGAELQRLAVATATALAAIHRAGLAHRDFKPACVLLGSGGPRVIGFGVTGALDTKLSATSNIVGTPAYMAPEQLAGQAVGPAADVFAWGSVLVFAATGTPPFGDDSLPAVINRILRAEPRLGELPQSLRAAVTRCLAKEPGARPAMHEVLLHLLGSPASPTPPSSTPPSPAAPFSAPPSPTPPHGSSAPPLPSPPASPSTPHAAPVLQDRSSAPSYADRQRAEGPADQRAAGPDRSVSRQGGAGHADADQWHTAPQAAVWQEPVSESTDPVRPVTGRAATWPPAAGTWEDSYDTPQPTAPPPPAPNRPAAPRAQTSAPGAFAPGTGSREAFDEQTFSSGAAGSGYGEQVWPPVERPDDAWRQEGAQPGQWTRDETPPSPGEPWTGDEARPAPGQPGDGVRRAPGETWPGGDARPAPGETWPGGEARPAPGEPEQWRQDPSGEPAPAKPRRRRGKTLVIAAASGLTAVVLAGAIVWLTPSSPQPRSQSLVSASSGASASASPTPSRKRPTRTRTPAPADHGSTAPAATSSADPAGTGSPTTGTVTGRLRLSSLRALGTRNGTCWAGDQVTLTALVERGGERLPFGYVWMVDGRVIGRASTVVEADGRLVVNAPRALAADGGTHLVTFRITTPVTRQRSLSLTFCQP